MKKLYRVKNVIVIFVCVFIFNIPVHAQDTIAEKGMVASAHPLASAVGVEILKNGGNAVDAAIATAFALAVVEPNASGLGGGGFMVVKMADSRQAVTIDYRECAPALANADLFYQTKESFSEYTDRGSKSIGVPGVVAGLTLALEKYGSMDLLQIVKPAIRLATEGFVVSNKFAAMILENYDLILNNTATAAIYLQDGLPKEQGMVIKNPDLAVTFKILADNGAIEFYKGDIGKKIVGQIKAADGLLDFHDLASYQAISRQPIYGTYRGYEIFSSAPPTGGGTHLIELLNILERYNLKKYRHNSAEYIHLLAEAMKMVFADKAENMADPAFYEVPVEKMTDKKYARNLGNRINMNRACFDYAPPKLLQRESGSTTHLSVVDEHHNMVALTQSINSFFGSGITAAGTGIILNNHLGDFESEPNQPNSIEPYKRPVSSIAPTIILKDGKPFLTIGTPGGVRIISALAQIIINIIDFRMNIDEAIEAPRVHVFSKVLNLEGRIPKEIANELEQKGHTIKYRDDFDNYFGGAQGILIDLENGKLHGGGDSRRDGVAIGY